TPPLYFVSVWFWAHVFGTSALGLRSLSAVAGTAAVPVAYLAGREMGTKRIALLAAALVAFNPFLVWYSQEARAYALLATLCACGLLFFLRALQAQERRALLWWAVASALALATHSFA